MAIKIPSSSALKNSGVDDRAKIKLVTEALLKTRETATPPLLLLERTGPIWLNQLYRHEVVWALEKILKSNRHLFVIIPHEYLEGASNEAKTLLTSVSGGKKWWEKWVEAPEDAPIILGISNAFDNWCEAQLHRQNITLKDLSEANRQKIYYTVVAIHQQFEVTSDPKVTIGWNPASDVENRDARELALQFLKNKDVVIDERFYYPSGVSIEVQIDVRKFVRFRDELFAYQRDLSQSAAEAPVNEGTAPSSNAFQAMEGLRWQDVQIKFVDGHTVRIMAKGTTETVDYKEMGFDDSRAHKPNSQWALLGLLAQNEGEISWGDSAAKDSVKKRKQVLSDTLKAFFHIDDEPFYPYRDEKAYRTKFTLKAEGG